MLYWFAEEVSSIVLVIVTAMSAVLAGSPMLNTVSGRLARSDGRTSIDASEDGSDTGTGDSGDFSGAGNAAKFGAGVADGTRAASISFSVSSSAIRSVAGLCAANPSAMLEDGTGASYVESLLGTSPK